jgi:RecA-family ATPase
VVAALDNARPLSASADLHQRIEDSIAGKFAAVAWPWPALGRLTKAAMPGTVTLVCGDPGAAKSFLLMQAVLHWQAKGVKVALYELEEDCPFWLARALAMLAGRSGLTDPDWVRQNPAAARAAYDTHRAELDAFARRLSVAGDKQLSHPELLAWIRQQAEAGCRVIAVDPVTALAGGDKPWLDDLKFMMEAKAIAARHGCSLLLVTHPRISRAKNNSPLDNLAGGAAYARFAQTVLWVNSHPHGKRLRWKTMAGDFSGPANRSVKIPKARNAAGGGLEVAFDFDGGTLRFRELGMVIKDTDDEGNAA